MANERSDHTLQATALVNEAFMRLVNIDQIKWQNRAHFFAMSARFMRRILVDSARARRYQKRGAGLKPIALDEAVLVSGPGDKFIELDEALTALADVDARKSQVVELRFFGGLTIEEIAAVLEVSPETVMRDWKVAKVWLLRELKRK